MIPEIYFEASAEQFLESGWESRPPDSNSRNRSRKVSFRFRELFWNLAGNPDCRIQIPGIVQGGSRSDFGNCSGIWLGIQTAAVKFPESFKVGLV